MNQQSLSYKYIYGFYRGFIYGLGTSILYIIYKNPQLLENIRR